MVTDIVESGTGEIIIIDAVKAGFWNVVENDEDILLSSVRLLPEFQNRGVGTELIDELLKSASKPIRLQVLKVNPARNLYLRLGFKVVGETETHYKMLRVMS